VIIWLNGTFGVGKTTTSKELAAVLPDARIFDSESVGMMLGPVLGPVVPVGDFQDWRPWRRLVVETAAQILDYVGGTLAIPQSVLVEQYWDELESGLHQAGITVHHFALHADQDALVQRIETDAENNGGTEWRLHHLAHYRQALPAAPAGAGRRHRPQNTGRGGGDDLDRRGATGCGRRSAPLSPWSRPW
jgi:hypothetical protein